MSLPTDTFTTYDAIGNREDLADIIYNVDPTDVPFLSAAAKVKAKAVNHEWQTDALASAVTTNKVLEGSDAITDAATATTRLGNICQISDKVPRVTGTQQVVDKAGRDNELDYQMIKKGKELKRDMETSLLQNGVKATGDATTARALAGILCWIATNDVFETTGSGSSPSPIDGTDVRNDGTQVAFTEARLKAALQLCWNSGGDPDRIMLGGFNKQVMSSFVGRGTPTEDTKSKKIIASVDVYESDFGTLKVIPNRFMRTRDVLLLQMDMWAVAYLRNMKSVDLAVTGDSVRKQILCEYTLEARNEKSSGGVFDNTTS
jgi:hypothetical protein